MHDHFCKYLLAGAFHRLAWVAWGDPAAPAVLCVHGLTRNGRDFDTLAKSLAADFWVIAPDLPGRGKSDWLPQPELYALPSYVTALAHLLAVIDRPVRWVGTSLGGICGMAIAAMKGNPVERLVLNDIGPFIPASALARIRDYMGAAPAALATLADLQAYLRRVHAPFGALSDAQWAQMAQNSARVLPDGRLALHYDPAIATPILAADPQDVDLWPVWSQIGVPRLVLRGEHSDLLEVGTLARMQQDGAAARTVPDCGHAPALRDAPTIEAIRDFLRA
jgi:pimeloyl-ACP methyl ester carboxylesterase